jgi:hypothetical protein
MILGTHYFISGEILERVAAPSAVFGENQRIRVSVLNLSCYRVTAGAPLAPRTGTDLKQYIIALGKSIP